MHPSPRVLHLLLRVISSPFTRITPPDVFLMAFNLKDYPDSQAEERIIVVLGPTGAGKPTFINTLTQRGDLGIGHGIGPGTTTVQEIRSLHSIEGHSVIFIDTPGFDDAQKSDQEIMVIVKNSLKKAIPNIVFVTTMWDDVEEEIGAKREEELKSKFWAEWIAKGCKIRRFNRIVHDSALNILRALPAKIGTSHSYEGGATGAQTEGTPAFLQVVLGKFSDCLSCRL
ncbi:hypothetical protein FRB91_006067 [Serendipita sp. 411]|nr:hypothetical protein FRB91_006067 [Serendipita sp. 411]